MNTRVSAIIINHNQEILLIHRIKNGNQYYVLPGGGIESNETETSAVIREIKEETNLDIQPDKKILELQNDSFDRIEMFFTIKSFIGNPALGKPELDRQSNYNTYKLEWIKINELQKYNLFPKEILQIIINLKKNDFLPQP